MGQPSEYRVDLIEERTSSLGTSVSTSSGSSEIFTHKTKHNEGSKCGCSKDYCKKLLFKKLPITVWLPKYNLTKLRCDAIAGLTVGLTVIPQALAYAAIAGLDLQYGLYSAFMGCFVYCFLGTSKDITLGPTAIMSIFVAQYARGPWMGDTGEKSNAQLAVILTMSSGLLQMCFGFFKLGCIVDFISHPVISGFTSAAAVVIGGGQIKKILGLHIESGHNFFEMIYNTFKHIGETRSWDLLLGLFCIGVLFLLKFLKEKTTKIPEKSTATVTFLYKLTWFVGTARNAVVVVFSSLLALCVTDMSMDVDERPLTLTPKTPGGLPPFQIPSFNIQVAGSNETVGFSEVISEMWTGIVVIALMGLLESVAIATAFARKNSYKIDATQELLALGTANVLSSFVGSYPVTGSFSRTAVNSQSHVMTPLGGIFTGSLVLLSLAFVSEAFQYIPSSALASVIIMAVINMFDFQTAKSTFKVNRLDTIPLVLTFLVSFWDLAYGILCGIAVSLFILMIPHNRPTVKFIANKDSDLYIKIKRGLDFPGTRYFEKMLYKMAKKYSCETLHLDCGNLSAMDYSAAEAFNFLFQRFHKEKISIRLVRLNENFQSRLIHIGIPRDQLHFDDHYDDMKHVV